jgi:hypothetical protein
MFALVVPSLIGGVAGAMLLKLTPTSVFDRLVPLLILFATCLFMAQDAVQRLLRIGSASTSGTGWFAGALAFQLAVGVYGGRASRNGLGIDAVTPYTQHHRSLRPRHPPDERAQTDPCWRFRKTRRRRGFALIYRNGMVRYWLRRHRDGGWR